MNKKIFVMLCVCLLGAISMTSCIDNKESESVTNIREAKAEQLKALAALSDAQAQAAKILAQAQATQAQAEALLAQAQAELIATQAEEQRLRNELIALQIAYEKALQYAKEEAELAKYRAEIAEAEARVAQAQAEVIEAQRRKAYAEQLIQENELRFQQEMLQLQLALEQTKANYEKDLKSIKDDAARAELFRLTSKYNDAMTYVQYYQERLVNAKNNLLRYKNGLMSTSTTVQTSIEDYDNNIEYYKEIIASAEEKIEYMKKYHNTTSDLDAQLKYLENEKILKYEALRQAQKASNNALTEASEKYNKFNTSTYVNNINKSSWIQLTNNATNSYSYYDSYSNHKIESNLAQYLENATVQVNYEYKSVRIHPQTSIRVDSVTLYVENPVNFGKTTAANVYKIENDNLQTLIEVQAEVKKKNDARANYLGDSIKVLDKIIEINPDSIINGDSVSVIKKYVADSLNIYNTNAVTAQKSIDKYNTKKQDLKYLYDACIDFSKNLDNLKKEINNYNKSLKDCYATYTKLFDVALSAEKAYNEVNNEYSVVSDLFYSSNYYSIENYIQQQESIIANYKAKIEEAERAKKELQTKWETINWEKYYNELIKGYEIELKLWEQRAAEAKAELEAATKGEPALDLGNDSDDSSDNDAE